MQLEANDKGFITSQNPQKPKTLYYEGHQYPILIHPSITCQNAIVVIYIYIKKKLLNLINIEQINKNRKLFSLNKKAKKSNNNEDENKYKKFLN